MSTVTILTGETGFGGLAGDIPRRGSKGSRGWRARGRDREAGSGVFSFYQDNVRQAAHPSRNKKTLLLGNRVRLEWHGIKPDFLDRAGVVAPRRPFCGADPTSVHMRSRCLDSSHLEGGRVPLSPGIVPHPFPDGLESHTCQFGLNSVPFGSVP